MPQGRSRSAVRVRGRARGMRCRRATGAGLRRCQGGAEGALCVAVVTARSALVAMGTARPGPKSRVLRRPQTPGIARRDRGGGGAGAGGEGDERGIPGALRAAGNTGTPCWGCAAGRRGSAARGAPGARGAAGRSGTGAAPARCRPSATARGRGAPGAAVGGAGRGRGQRGRGRSLGVV